MYQLFETIRICEGKPENLALHEKRMNSSRRRLYGSSDNLQLPEFIQIPDEFKTGLIKCRVIYDTSLRSVEYSPYVPAIIKTLITVKNDTLNYDLKYLDRSCLSMLVNKEIADDVLIIKNGFVTDTSFANIVFTDGRRWVTPDTPLLSGTMREKLIAEDIIREERITIDDITRFTHFRLINAMIGFGSLLQPISNIIMI
jgi:4-amino-4-deoxychorismate lyase